MRIYHGSLSPKWVRKAREAAPSHVHGAVWTPSKLTDHEYPYFIDNGAYSGSFEPNTWIQLLEDTLAKMSREPEWVVLPDVLNDAKATEERHRAFVSEVTDRDLAPAAVFQPGLPLDTQLDLALDLSADVVFVGGGDRFKSTHGPEIVNIAHEEGLRAHLGSPGSPERLLWAFRTGFDSVDISSIVQNKSWFWLEHLEKHSKEPPSPEEHPGSQLLLPEISAVEGGDL